MEGLNLDNILDEDALSLFNDDVGTPDNEEDTQEEDNKKQEDTTEVDPSTLFDGEEEPESVGSDEDNEEQEGAHSNKSGSTSPKTDFFSSIAEAFAEEGILPNLDEETIKGIKTPEDFRKAIDDYIKSELSEQQQRVADALNNNVEPDAIRQYEGVIGYLDNLSEEDLKSESENGENLRKRIIFQDLMNRGFSQQRAEKEVNKSIQNGTDIEDALDALNGCKSFYKNAYNDLLKQAKEEKEKEEEQYRKRSEDLKKSILDEKSKFFGDMDLDKSTRQKVYESISKPIYKDPKTGEVFTAIQKYEMDNRDEFLVKLGLVFTLTDGFKSLDKLVDKKAKKVIKRGFKDLEERINNSSRDTYGNLKFASGVEDGESYLGKGLKLAL